jgi:hypothetical protein
VLHPCDSIVHGVKLPAVVADGIDVLSPLGQSAGVRVRRIVGVFDGVPPGEIKMKGEGRGEATCRIDGWDKEGSGGKWNSRPKQKTDATDATSGGGAIKAQK